VDIATVLTERGPAIPPPVATPLYDP